jgi:hypothetical protein
MESFGNRSMLPVFLPYPSKPGLPPESPESPTNPRQAEYFLQERRGILHGTPRDAKVVEGLVRPF